MASLFLDLFDYLTRGIHKIKRKYGLDNKKCKECGTKYKDCVILNIQTLKMI